MNRQGPISNERPGCFTIPSLQLALHFARKGRKGAK